MDEPGHTPSHDAGKAAATTPSVNEPPASPETPADAAAHASGMLAAAVRIVSGLTLFSRVAGLLRDMVMVRMLSDGVLASAFRAAYTLPNLFRRLFGEGALSAAFLPEYTQLRRDHPEVASQLASITLRLLTLATGGLTLLIELVLLGLILFVPDDASHAGRDISFKMMMLMLPMMPMVCITAILGGVLQAHGKFGPPAAAPIILNVFQIVASFGYFMGWMTDKLFAAYFVGAAAVIASVVQIVWSLWALQGCVSWSKAGEEARKHGRRVFGRFVPAVLGLGTLQLNTMMDSVIAMWPVWIGPTVMGVQVTLDASSNGILSYTQQLYQFPLGVFGLAVATAVFPLLSRASDNLEEFTQVLRRGLRLSYFIGLPASLGLVMVRHDLMYVVYGGKGGFSHDGVMRGASVLMGFSPGVWAYSLNHVLTRAFYAKHNTRTPMRVAMVMVLLNFALNVTLIWPLRESGLAWSTAISAVAQTLVLLALCKSRLGVRPFDGETARAFVRVTIVGAVMAGAVGAVNAVWPEPERGWMQHAFRLSAGVAAGAAAYTGASFLLRAPEIRWLMQKAPKGAGGGAASAMSFD
jgi:putative peptidoglycan lipid II flippase